MNLIDALPLDGQGKTRHFTIKRGHHNHEPIHFRYANNHHQTDTPESVDQASLHQSRPLNGDQYAALNKLKGIRQSLDNLKSGQQNEPDLPKKLVGRYHKITKALSSDDKRALADQLRPIHQDLNKLGLQAGESHQAKNPTQPAANDGQPLVASDESATKKSPTTPTKPKAPFSSQKRQYVVQRELSGATLLTENGQDAGHISESIVRKMNLTSGTIVKADIMPNDIFVHKALRHIDHLGKTVFDDAKKIAIFEFGVVKKHKHHLRVTYNSNNEPLLVNGKKHVFLLDLDNPIVGNGSIVELAWYKDDPDSMRIRWTYPTNKPAQSTSGKKSPAPDKGESANDDQKSLSKRYTDLDLQGKTVAVLVGNRQEHEDYERQIKLYNGKPTVVDSFKTQKSYLKDKLKSADIVVLIKSKAHHGASKAVAEFQNQFGFAFAVADSIAMGQFEDALYRASHGLPADIVGMANLN